MLVRDISRCYHLARLFTFGSEFEINSLRICITHRWPTSPLVGWSPTVFWIKRVFARKKKIYCTRRFTKQGAIRIHEPRARRDINKSYRKSIHSAYISWYENTHIHRISVDWRVRSPTKRLYDAKRSICPSV